MFVKIRINIWSCQLLFVSLRTNFKVMDKNYSEKQEKLARFAKALGHPARIAVMQFLAKQEQCYFGDIHEELPIAKATVSQHLSELKDALTSAVSSGKFSEEKLDQVRKLHREAQWFFDFCYVENAEGAHNSDLAYHCLDTAEEKIDQAMTILKN